jgi:DNA-binding CsgD family transcriptional regulator
VSLTAANIAPLVEEVGSPGFFGGLHAALEQVIPFQNFIVLAFERGRTGEILHTNIEERELRRKMTPYLRGLYELDPFVIASAAGDPRRFAVMGELAPEEFFETEFYRAYYHAIEISEESRFLIQLDPDRWTHILVEREHPAPGFSAEDRTGLAEVADLVVALVRKHHELMAARGEAGPQTRALDLKLVDVLSAMHDAALTRREVEVAEMILQGHSPKAVARRLGISGGTVINHKRHIYEKLEVHSQAQLFNLVLAALFGRDG